MFCQIFPLVKVCRFSFCFIIHFSSSVVALTQFDLSSSDVLVTENESTEFVFVLLIKEFVGRLSLQRDQGILEVGCGTGGSAFYIADVSVNNCCIYLFEETLIL